MSVNTNKMVKCMTDCAQVDIVTTEDLMFGKLALPSQQIKETSNFDVMSVMMTDACISEERMTKIERKIDMPLRTVKEKDREIALPSRIRSKVMMPVNQVKLLS